MTLLFQEQNLFPHLSVAENVGLGLDPGLRLSRAQAAQVEAALARVGLEGFGSRLPKALSGGQRSRAALARALLRARPLLLLDEPFAALGPGQRVEMLGLVKEVAAETGASVLMVTHDPAEARRLAGLASFVSEGVAAAPEPVDALLDRPPPALAAYLGTG